MNRIYDYLKKTEKPLLHITEFDNLESILNKGGLLSLKKLKSKGIEPNFMTSESSRSIDGYKDTTEYVRLAYTPLYDMLPAAINSGSLQNPVAILITPEILKNKTKMLFTTENAVASGAKYYKQDEIGDYIDWGKVFSPRNIDTVRSIKHKNARQSEVMIPKMVELKYFMEIVIEEGNDIDSLKKYNVKLRKAAVKKVIERFGNR